jgi:hypothetical protein
MDEFTKNQVFFRFLPCFHIAAMVGLVFACLGASLVPALLIMVTGLVAGFWWAFLKPYVAPEAEAAFIYFYEAFYFAETATGPIAGNASLSCPRRITAEADIAAIEDGIIEIRPDLTKVALTNLLFLRKEPVSKCC